MNEITIKKHSFELAKNRLKNFSEQTEAEYEIKRVKTEGGFLWLGDHKVTGDELNERLETIQKHFIAVNETNNKVIKEFREVYNALDVLDRDYITSIVNNVKAIEKTSNDVRVQQGTLEQHNEELAKHQNKLDTHQVEIEKNVANISKIVNALKVFKEKLEGYKHLTDIDRIWSDSETIQNEIRVVSDSIIKFSKKTTEDIAAVNAKNKDLSEKLEDTVNLLDNQLPVIRETACFAEHLKTINHIDDVDSMWDDINKVKENFDIIENSLQNIGADILKMQKHIDGIDSFVAILNGYIHLQDIDKIWDDLEVCKTNIEKINGDIQTHQNKLDILDTTSTEHKESIDTLSKKMADAEAYAVDSRNLITELEVFRAEISALNHLMEVDNIWKHTEDHQIRIKKVEQEGKSHTDKLDELGQADSEMCVRINSNAHDIKSLKEYKDKLSGISHLDDVDSIWKDVEKHTSLLTESEKREEDLAAAIQKNKKDAEADLASAIQKTNSTIEFLTKKIKYAYWIAGGAGGLAIIELILLLL